jgi:hypothetical protein
MPKFLESTYFMQVWNNRQAMTSGSLLSRLNTVVSMVDACMPAPPGGWPPVSSKLIGLVAVDSKVTSPEAPGEIQRYLAMAGEHAGSLYICMLGEDHDDRTDKFRGQAIAKQLGVSPIQPTLVVLEKGLSPKYPMANVDGAIVVKEEDICPHVGISIKGRSTVMAGYLVLCALAGPSLEKIVMFFGEEHRDIFGMMEHIITNSAAAKPLAARYRYYHLVRSYTTKPKA